MPKVSANLASPAPASALEVAIDWMVLLQSGEASTEEQAGFEAWLQSDAMHAQAWAQVQGAMHRALQPAQGRQARAALLRVPRRHALRRLLTLAGVGGVAAWTASQGVPTEWLLADVRTGTAERRSMVLADGSRLLLNARSAVDMAFGAAERTLYLRQGEVIVTAAPDAMRPFVVRSVHGQVQALGTRFLVRQERSRTLAMVLEHSVRVRTLAGTEYVLAAGEAAAFDAVGTTPLTGPQALALASWEFGMLRAPDLPLEDVIDALRPYRRGFIRLSPGAARIRVLGAFALDDPDLTIESLVQTLPLRVVFQNRWLVVLERDDGS